MHDITIQHQTVQAVFSVAVQNTLVPQRLRLRVEVNANFLKTHSIGPDGRHRLRRTLGELRAYGQSST